MPEFDGANVRADSTHDQGCVDPVANVNAMDQAARQYIDQFTGSIGVSACLPGGRPERVLADLNAYEWDAKDVHPGVSARGSPGWYGLAGSILQRGSRPLVNGGLTASILFDGPDEG